MSTAAPGVDMEAIKKLLVDAGSNNGAKGNDGGQMSEVLKMLTNLQGQVTTIQTENTALKTKHEAADRLAVEYRKASKILTDPKASDADVKAATKFMLVDQGLTPEQAEEQVATMFSEETAAPTGNPGSPKPKAVEQTQIDAFGKQVQGVRAEVAAERGKRLTAYFQTAVRNSPTVNEQMRKLLEVSVKQTGGKKDLAEKAKEAALNRVSEDAYTRLQIKATQKGGVPLDEADIDTEVNAAIERNVGFVKQTLGEFDQIGRVPETVGGSGEFDVDAINKAAARPPEFKAGQDPADLRKELNDWTVASLQKDALESLSTGESKA